MYNPMNFLSQSFIVFTLSFGICGILHPSVADSVVDTSDFVAASVQKHVTSESGNVVNQSSLVPSEPESVTDDEEKLFVACGYAKELEVHAKDGFVLIEAAIKKSIALEERSKVNTAQEQQVSDVVSVVQDDTNFCVACGICAIPVLVYAVHTLIKKQRMSSQRMIALVLSKYTKTTLQNAYLKLLQVLDLEQNESAVVVHLQKKDVACLLKFIRTVPSKNNRRLLVAVMLKKFNMNAASKTRCVQYLKSIL